MARRNVWRYDELEKLRQDEIEQLLAEIPSDGESEDDYVDEEDNEPTPVDELEIPINNQEDNSIENDSDEENDTPLALRLPKDIFNWRKAPATANQVVQDFLEETGPSNIPDGVETPIEIFTLLVDEEIFEHFAFQTNLYATQKGKAFVPTNCKEIKIFLAINILMGIKKLPSYRDYWSSKPELRDSYISSLMSRSRFDWLLGNFHLNDNSLQPRRGDPEFDKLYKLRPFLNSISRNFKHFYHVHRTISIDESMILFKGRSSLRQYMPKKPIKWGYKVWTRADESGYIDEFQIYTGKVKNATEKQLGPRVIYDLTRSLVGKNYFIYFDNFFTTFPLLRQLKNEKIYATGTLRKDRKGMCDDLKCDKTLKRGDYDWRTTIDGLSLVKWMDKRIVLLASNFENPLEIEYVSRRNKDGETENIPCPKMLKNYNQNMGFVDKADMLKKTYEINRKSKKWWHRIFWHFIDVSVVNSHIIFQKRCDANKNLTLKEFRLAIVSGLVGAGTHDVSRTTRASQEARTSCLSKYKPVVPLEKRFDQALHMPVYGTYRRCGLCSTKTHQRRTKWACASCGVALCLSDTKNCFQEFHKKQ